MKHNLAKHSLVYIASSIMGLLSGVLMLPMYSYHLTPEQYGIVDTVLRFTTTCMGVVFVGMNQGYLRYFFEKPDAAWQRTISATMVIGIPALVFVLAWPLLLFAKSLSLDIGPLKDFPLDFGATLLIAVWLALEAAYFTGLSCLQVRFLSVPYATAQIIRTAMLLGTSYLFLYVLDMSLQGALMAHILTSIGTGLASGFLLLKWGGLHFSMPAFKSVASFGLPFVPTVLLAYVSTNADRFALILTDMIPLLGLLAIASKIGEMGLALLMGPVENVWLPYAMSVHKEKEGAAKIGLLYLRYVAFGLFVVLGTSLAAPYAIALLTAPDYHDASRLVPFIAIGCLCVNLAALSDLGILISKRTGIKPYVFGATAAVAVGLQLLLTPRAGVIGAVIATALTGLFQLTITHVIAARFYRMAINHRKLLVLLVGASAGYLAGSMVMNGSRTLLAGILGTTTGVLVYAAAVAMGRIIGIQDIKTLLSKPRSPPDGDAQQAK